MHLQYESMIQGLLENGFGSLDNWFSEEEIQNLRQSLRTHYERNVFHEARIGKNEYFQKEKSIRTDQVYWLHREQANQAEQSFFEKMNGFVSYLNNTCYAGIRDYEFHYAMYPPGSFYKRHVDRFKNDNSRLFSFVTYLTESWQVGDGGELVLYYKNQAIPVFPIPGKVIFFRSELEHEVLLSNSDRLSLTGWLKGGSVVL